MFVQPTRYQTVVSPDPGEEIKEREARPDLVSVVIKAGEERDRKRSECRAPLGDSKGELLGMSKVGI